jgi:2-hydroxychromene-2-carboxylate isomerase
MPSAEWYFDFVSPFSYLQCEQLPALEKKLRIHYRPVLFAGLLKVHGHKGPAEIPAKRRFTYRYPSGEARALGVPFKFPAVHPFNPLPLLRLASPPIAIPTQCAAYFASCVARRAARICRSNGRS